jgi:hypothetical protein
MSYFANFQRWALALFSRFCARKREAKKERKKAEAASVKEKSANSRFFLPPQWKSSFRTQSHSAGGKQGS